MAYSNKFYSSGFYRNLWPRPQFQPGEVVVDDIRHKVGNEWSSINPGSTDNTGDVLLSGFAYAYAKIEIYDNGKLLFTTQAGRLGTWTADLSDVISAGNHNFMVKQAGYGFAPGAPINLIVEGNNSEIPVEITQVYSDSSVLHDGNHTNDARPSFRGKGPANAKVLLVDENNNVVASGNTDIYGNWNVKPEYDINDGSYNFRAFINGKYSSDINLTIDTTPPDYTLTFTGAFDLLTYEGIPENGKTNDLRPNFTGKAAPGSAIYLFVEGSNEPIGGTITNGFGEWSITAFKDLELGTQTLEVRADNQTAQFTLTIEAGTFIQPVTIDYLVDGQTFDTIPENGLSNDSTPWISGKSAAFANILLLEGTKFLGFVQADEQGKWNYELTTALDAGQHAITAFADGQTSEPFNFSIAAQKIPGKGWGGGIYSVNDLLIEDETSLFAQDIEQPEVATLVLNQSDLTTQSDAVGIEIAALPLTAADEEQASLPFA